MEFMQTGLDGVLLLKPKKYLDERGYFLESYKKNMFHENGIFLDFSQDNLSFSKKNVLRGLHFQQSPFEQAKLVRCISGSIFDVAVDIRLGSPTFGKWLGYELNEDNCHSLLIPGGFAHGFYVMSDNAFVSYKVDNPYHANSEGSIIYNDPDIGIIWPGTEFILSEKDKLATTLELFQKS
jgi:dTDP-4-dehydrorhamnose 3,5-epimerase